MDTCVLCNDLCFFLLASPLQAPFEETDTGGIVTLNQFMDTQAVKDMRDAVEADLVQLIGYFNDGFCGWG